MCIVYGASSPHVANLLASFCEDTHLPWRQNSLSIVATLTRYRLASDDKLIAAAFSCCHCSGNTLGSGSSDRQASDSINFVGTNDRAPVSVRIPGRGRLPYRR